MRGESTSTPPGVGSAYTPKVPPRPPAPLADAPPSAADERDPALTTSSADLFVSQAMLRAVAARKGVAKSGPARTLSLEEEVFIRLHHGCQG